MDSRVISISVPKNMLIKIDEAAAISFQTRSNFIRFEEEWQDSLAG